jgi:tRNA uridine 5-carboxymethylaminomethyl modification enzyme
MQQDLVRMVPGLEQTKIIRPGYAIEYDYVDPRELGHDLQCRRVTGLFHAGQVNGTTGYEEAACQGLLAGINAAMLVQNRRRFRLNREESYIGVLVDDLIRHGVDEPYRIFTSRAECRLSLRHDNADERLRRYGREVGLVGDSDWDRFNQRRDRIAKVKASLQMTRLRRADSAYAGVRGLVSTDLGESISLADLARRAGIKVEILLRLLPAKVQSQVGISDLEAALADDLYAGYIKIQEAARQRLAQHDSKAIPESLDFRTLSGLSHEMVERLERLRPLNFAEARRIPGLTPAALSTLFVSVNSLS